MPEPERGIAALVIMAGRAEQQRALDGIGHRVRLAHNHEWQGEVFAHGDPDEELTVFRVESVVSATWTSQARKLSLPAGRSFI
jgi:hypothetical protein